MLLGGERRITAIDKLIEDPNVQEWNEDTLIPCVIKNLEEIDLPLSDEAKEQYALITTNKEARKYTDSDRYIEVMAWKKIIDELRANGVPKHPNQGRKDKRHTFKNDRNVTRSDTEI